MGEITESDILAPLLRIMDKARAYTVGDYVTYEGLAQAYEDAIYKEIADLTGPMLPPPPIQQNDNKLVDKD